MKTPTMNTWNRHAGISIRPSRKAAPPPILPKVLRTHVSPIFTWSQVSLWTFTGRLHFFVREQILTSLMRALRSGSLAQSDSGSRRVSTCRASRPCCSALRGGLPGRQAHRSLPPLLSFPLIHAVLGVFLDLRQTSVTLAGFRVSLMPYSPRSSTF